MIGSAAQPVKKSCIIVFCGCGGETLQVDLPCDVIWVILNIKTVLQSVETVWNVGCSPVEA